MTDGNVTGLRLRIPRHGVAGICSDCAVSQSSVQVRVVSRGRCFPCPQLSPVAGFTLVELLVVLAIATLLIALAPPLFSSVFPSFSVKTAARELAADLRDARREAITQHRKTWVTLTEYSFRRSGTKRQHSFPRAVRLERAWVPTGQRMGHAIRLSFYPDGSASGGKVRLGSGSARLTVAVNWLTGRVSINE